MFLHNKVASIVIAKIALGFQSILTILIVEALFISIKNNIYPHPLLVWLFLIDSIFVVVHLTYRVLYKGENIPFAENTKYTLIAHGVTSLSALFGTWLLVQNEITHVTAFTVIVIITWIISLLLGILFFKQKYLAK